MEFTDKPKNAKIHVPDFNQFKAVDDSEKLDHKLAVGEKTPIWDDILGGIGWDNLPDWVKWVAQDSTGDLYGFADVPKIADSQWHWLSNDMFVFITSTELHPDGWENTLTRRPEKRSERVSVEGKVNVSVEDIKECVTRSITRGDFDTLYKPERFSVEGKVNVSVEDIKHAVKPITREGLAKACDSGDLNIYFTGGIEDGECLTQQSTQPHYQTKTGIDFIQRFSDVHSEERVRGALLFNIGKYCERYGQKDDILKEARKIADYANRLVKFEESLLEDKDG